MKKNFTGKLSLILLIALLFVPFIFGQQITVPRIEQMPDLPSPYNMRDWKKVAVGYDSLVFNPNLSGQYLPLIEMNSNGVNYPGQDRFWLHTVVGTTVPNSDEAINAIPAVVGATLAGVDKSDQNGKNFVKMCEEWFNKKNGLNVYKNHPDDMTYDDWWYETMPNIFFYELYDLYPNIDVFKSQFEDVANQWLKSVQAMGGSTTPWSIPNMDHRGWNLQTMQPYNASVHEPEAAGAIAWLLYNAYIKTKDTKYRIGAEQAMEFLNKLSNNPAYELQLSYGVYTAAKMNAELGTNYDIQKMVNWCFDVGPLRSWGAMANSNWGGYDTDGLIGEVNGNNNYPFAMNTFEQIGTLVPMVRYDERFARAIGKWVLNAANAARLFYPKYLPSQNQDTPSFQWSSSYDTNSYIAHEAIHQYKPSNYSISPYASGDAVDGGWGKTNLTLYGSSHVGILGGIIDTTNVEGILQLNMLKTDYFHAKAYPTYLYYNPFPSAKSVEINTGTGNHDVYDVVSKTFLLKNISGVSNINIPSNSAVVAVIVPAGGSQTYDLDKFLIDGVVVDYHSGNVVSNYPPRIKSLSTKSNLILIGDSSYFYCTAVDRDSDSLKYNWSSSAGNLSANTSTANWIAPLQEGTYTISCTVSDGKSEVSSTDTVTVVKKINQPPAIIKLTAEPRKMDLNSSSKLTCYAVDPDNDSLKYSWHSSHGIINGTDSNAVWNAPSVEGNYYISCFVSDGNGGNITDSIEVEVRDFSNTQSGEMVAYYPFNGNANDESGNNNNGSVHGANLTSDRFGNPNSAYSFNGINDYISVPSSSTLNFQKSITINFWMMIKNFFNREQYVISQGSYDNRLKISIIPNNHLRWTIKTNSSNNNGIIDLDTETQLVKDSLYNVTVLYSGSDYEIYLNGNLDSFSSWSCSILQTSIPLTFAQMLPSDQNYNFNGTLDDIRIYNYALSVEQIKKLYNISTGINKDISSAIPKTDALLQNYPNPFNPSTKIRFLLKRSSFVTISIYNSLGQKITDLIKGNYSRGSHSVTWDADKFASGIYYYSLKTGSNTFYKKMILLK